MLGAVADDFTGATDLAGNWRKRGRRTAVALGVPSQRIAKKIGEYDAVVVALKIRSAPVDQAVAQALEAGNFLLENGAAQIYDKYCSTFDSTPEGNIGPIADALVELTGADRAVVVPAFPDAGRQVIGGLLYVDGVPLAKSHMAHHPLNPMTDSSIVRLMAAQTDRVVSHIGLDIVRKGERALADELGRVGSEATYIVIDAETNEDLEVIAVATADDVLVTAGSGIALGAPKIEGNLGQVERVEGRKLILSGSASARTQEQVAHGKAHLPSIKIDYNRLVADIDGLATELRAWVNDRWAENPKRPVLIYSVDSPEDVEAGKKISPDLPSLIEDLFAILASDLYRDGARQIISAGGETSGSVAAGLGIELLDVGELLAPGLSWLRGETADGMLNIVLKSGNFGYPDLFTKAWDEL